MRKIWLIIQREYITRVKTRSFVITTLLAPAGFALFFGSMIFIAGYGESKKRIVVHDESGLFKGRFADPSNASLHLFFSDSTMTWLEANYKKINSDGILFIPPISDINNPAGIQFKSDKQIGLKSKEYIEEEIEKVLREKKIERANIDREVLENIDDNEVSIEPIVYGEAGEKKGSTIVATIIGYVMGFIIYTVLFIYGAMVMKGVAEEKTSRIMEILASSVRPFQLMMGKVIGIGAVGLTQFVLWFFMTGAVFIFFGIAFGDKMADIQNLAANPQMASSADQYEAAMALASLPDQPVLKYLFFLLFFFFAGYLMYGSLYAALGSAANEEGDSQSLTIFISFPIIISIIIMMSAIQEPDSGLAVWSSIIPFTAPIVMPARIPFDPPAWQLAASMLSVIAGFILTTWVAAKIYRTGILMYGKKVTAKELWKWAWKSDAF